jgi:hypothetical protein
VRMAAAGTATALAALLSGCADPHARSSDVSPAPGSAASSAPASAAVMPAARAPRLSVEPAHFDFGQVRPQRTLQKEFALRNFGASELRVEGVSTDCGCTAALLDDRVLPPGGRATLRVTFETRDSRGRVSRQVLVRSNDPRAPQQAIRLDATIVPEDPAPAR